jgi:hypothetical protein
MRKLLSLLLILIAFAQTTFSQKKSYGTTNWELIFSFAEYQLKGEKINTPPRFSFVFHFGKYKHLDLTKNIGLYSGAAMRNVGFSSKISDTLVKRRVYTIGVPLAIKIGDLGNDKYLYAGGEAEFAFHFKEKTFVNDKKTKESEWFSSRNNLFLPSVFVGVNFKSGLNLKFKYYLEDLYNTDYTKNGMKLYENVNSSQMFYFSISMNVRKGSYYGKSKTYNKNS